MTRSHAFALLAPIFAGLLLFGLSACAEDDKHAAELAANRDLWERQGIHDYEFVYQVRGFDAAARFGRVRLSIRQDEVVSAVALDEGAESPTEADLQWLPIVGDLFAEVDRQGSSVRTLEFDATRGFPVEAWFNWGSEGGGFEVTDFTATAPVE